MLLRINPDNKSDEKRYRERYDMKCVAVCVMCDFGLTGCTFSFREAYTNKGIV